MLVLKGIFLKQIIYNLVHDSSRILLPHYHTNMTSNMTKIQLSVLCIPTNDNNKKKTGYTWCVALTVALLETGKQQLTHFYDD